MTLITAAILFLFVPARADAVSSDSCVECHRALDSGSDLEHSFIEWERSNHAKAGVSCQACHKGDPSLKDKAAAHKGLLPSGDAKSTVYFTNIPATCGACHAAQSKAFQKSAHYKELRRSGRGPNCLTCHGSMANEVLAPRQLETLCTVCHRRPTLAYAALLALNNARTTLGRLEAALARAPEKKVDGAAQGAEAAKARADFSLAVEGWHTFKMADVLRRSQDVTRRSATALTELRAKGLE